MIWDDVGYYDVVTESRQSNFAEWGGGTMWNPNQQVMIVMNLPHLMYVGVAMT